MTLSRRSFFKLSAGTAVVALLPSSGKSVPMIYGDGKNCDAAGVNAFIRGEVVEFNDPSMAVRILRNGNQFLFSECRFTLGQTLSIPRDASAQFISTTFHHADGFEYPLICVEDGGEDTAKIILIGCCHV